MAGVKLNFNDLEYIVMEGGGARGVAYLGAIRALEQKMSERADVHAYSGLGGRKAGLLDYSQTTDKNLVIKGIAGSSAGAITAFALALGLNSDEIDKVLNYPFNNFLKDVHVGKYRMIDEEGRLAIGQDKKGSGNYHGKELTKESEFKFSFESDCTDVPEDSTKKWKRKLLFGTCFKIIVDGVISNIQQLRNIINQKFRRNSSEVTSTFWSNIIKLLAQPDNKFIARIGISQLFKILLFYLFHIEVIELPIKIENEDSVIAAVADRGMFSGFAVREFFLDLVIYAATRNTHFHRKFVELIKDIEKKEISEEYVNNNPWVLEIDIEGLSNALLKYKNHFSLKEGRAASKIGNDKDLKFALHVLSNLTFKQFNQITGINFGVCVTNYTSGLPVYFGHEWTPDFRIMEAVGASMTIPPAIKPLYNASDVVQTTTKHIKVNGRDFVDSKGNFELTDYYFYEHIVKIALAKEIANDPNSDKRAIVNVNNAIDLSAFLPKLKELAYGYYDTTNKIWIDADKKHSTDVIVNNKLYKVDYDLYLFFYNATYKGLLIDGGYRNNIPFNFFRQRNNNIDTVLAIKLDGSFPADIMKEVFDAIKNNLKNVDISEIIGYIEFSKLESLEFKSKIISRIVQESKSQTYKTIEAAIIKETKEVFLKYLYSWVKKGKDGKEKRNRQTIVEYVLNSGKYDTTIKELICSTLKKYRKKFLTAPWAVPKSIFKTAIEGYRYGNEQEQIKDISDHNQILPLYDYGIEVYDFDMDKIPLILLAQVQAEQATLNFFNTP